MPTITPAAWRNAVIAIFAANGLAIGTLMSRLPGLRDHLELTSGGVGVFILGFSSGSLVGLLFASHLLHAIGTRRQMRIMLAGLGVTLALIAVAATVADSYPLTIAVGSLFGASAGLCDVAMNVDGAANERVLGRTVMPWFHAGFSLGTVVGAGLGSFATWAGIDIWLHFAVVGAVLLAVAATAPRWIPREATGEDAEEKPSFRERMAVWLEPRTLIIGVLVLCFAYTEGSANDWLPIALIDGRGLLNEQGALMLTVFTTAMTIGRIGGVWVLDRWGRVPVLLGSAALAAIGLSLVIWVPAIPVIVVGIVLWGLGASLGFPVGMSAAADEPRGAAARVSTVAMVGYLAFLVGPATIGWVGESVGVLNALVIILGLIVVAGIVSPAARPLRVKQDA